MRRRLVNELSSSALDPSHARERVCRARIYSSSVCGSRQGAVSLFQLWRLHAYSVGCFLMAPVNEPHGELVIQTIAMPKDTNPSGDVFGGWLMSQMDLGSGILATKTAKGRVVTVAMEGMTFLQPVRVGDTVA